MPHPLLEPWALAVRARRVLARPLTRRVLVVAVAVATGLTVTALVRSAETARTAWGDSQPVVVAVRDLQPGDTVDAGAVEVRELPATAVAAHALTEVPGGAVVRHPVAAGEPLVADRLAPMGLSGVAALVPEGHRAVAVPVGPAGVPPLRVGDQVDVLAVLPTTGDIHGHSHADGDLGGESGEGSQGPEPEIEEPVFPVAERALVVDVTEQAVSIAVPTIDAPSVVATLTQGVVLLTLAGA